MEQKRALFFAIALMLTTTLAMPPAAVWAEAPVAPGPGEIEDAIPEGGALTGEDIYQRFLQNRFQQSFQELRVVSRDPGGSAQVTHFTIALKDYRDENDEPIDGINAKMLVEVSAPFDMRHTAYLMISKEPGPDDEFVYQPSERRVKRVDLKNASLLGTDFTFNDIAFKDIEDADYTRLPDELIDGVVVYVVEANVKETIDVEYHRTVSYMEKEHYIPLRTRYWDDFGVEIKEMTAPHSAIREFGTSWVATEANMRDLRQQTSSTLYVEDLDTEPDFHRKVFSVSSLAHGN